MSAVTFEVRDLLWFASLLVSVALAYGRLRSEIRHLEDTKSERHEVQLLGEELRGRLSDIMTLLARLEEALRRSAIRPQEEDGSSPGG